MQNHSFVSHKSDSSITSRCLSEPMRSPYLDTTDQSEIAMTKKGPEGVCCSLDHFLLFLHSRILHIPTFSASMAVYIYISSDLNNDGTMLIVEMFLVWSVVGSGLIAAVLVTAGVYALGLSEGLLGDSRVSRRVSKQSGAYYDGHYDGLYAGYDGHYDGHYGGQHQHRWGRRQEGLSQQLARIMGALSVESVQVRTMSVIATAT